MTKKLTRRKLLKYGAIGGAAGLGTVALGRIDTTWISLEKSELKIPRWTKSGLKIGYLSDTHLTDDWAIATTQKAVDLLLEQNPDVIVFGGDFVESSRQGALARMETAFRRIKETSIPALAVLGNHDVWSAVPNRIIHKARSIGFKMLVNESVEIGGVTFVGLNSTYSDNTDVAKFQHLSGKEDVVVLLHEPDGVDLLNGLGSVMLSGHSHGGQICLPGGFILHTPKGARKYIRGYYPDAPTPLFISQGVGVTGLRIRLFCPPQANLITLNSRTA